MTIKWLETWIMNRAVKISERQKMDSEIIYKSSIKDRTLQAVSIGAGNMIRGSSDNRLDTHADLNFKMYHAENGYVMEVRHIDRKTERQSVNLHVITEDQDLGEAISHILTIESLKIK
jgi:hypothetical protein